MLSSTVQAAHDTMIANRIKFDAFCRSLSEEQLERPVPNSDWRVKDFIIHLAQFDDETRQWMEGLREGNLERMHMNPDGSKFDVDTYNNARIEERREWPLERILAEGDENRAKLAQEMELLEDEHIEQVVHFPGDNKRGPADVQFKLFLTGLARHDPVHVADMIKALPEHAEDPEVIAWLDDGAVKWYQRAMSGPPVR